MKKPGRPCGMVSQEAHDYQGERETDTMLARSHESVIPEIATDICLDHFAADSIARDKIFILTACHNGFRSSQMSREWRIYFLTGVGHKNK